MPKSPPKKTKPKTEKVQSSIQPGKTQETAHSITWFAAVAALFIIFSVVNTSHLSKLFENDRHFSHLADFEREMTYRTEMGLYYSYYKTLITSPSFFDGITKITRDNVTEYGHTINTLKRFNLYPEVVLSYFYRNFKAITDKMGWRVQTCWQVNRGGDLPPVESCEGVGNPHYFYVGGAFVVAGTVAGWLFLLGVVLSDSILGGLLSVAAFAFNHGESTRVQWTPPLRESFSYPLILAQITLVTIALRNHVSGSRWLVGISIPIVLSMLSWQFAQFVYSTQLAALSVTFALDYLPRSTFSTLIFTHIFSLLVSFVLLFGNEMLLTSFYFPSILAALSILLIDRCLNKMTFRPLFVFLLLSIYGAVTVGAKMGLAMVFNVEDDAHIGEILRSKFTDFASFHTRLYTCSAEFGFIQQETLEKLTNTGLLPTALTSFLLIAIFLLRSRELLWRDTSTRLRPLSHLPFHFAQTAAFVFLAFIIMRLKLFMTPHLCASVALIMSANLISSSLNVRLAWIVRVGLSGLVLAGMAYQGMGNIKHQLSISGEYSNVEQELLFEWINDKSPKDAVFAGTMPVMANVKLSTERPIVNHPHYEDKGIRERTLKVYSMFSKKPITEVYDGLKKMGVNYVVIQPFNCDHHPRKECSYRSMWDLHDPQNEKRTSLCDIWQTAYKLSPKEANKKVAPFKFAYNHASYIVFKID
ncbi:dpy-19 [Pristionchus pacificus]|uniref:Dpy-19 n=1 Tax=Pristionchus pacificus TaxID=54126 RepID=A0A2A6BA93_PRIPA|nr:dpy-19 [Pristionchus pacificus]|eukprot:PDM62802.1 dpy-19 [Pristionchus pacificus]